MAYEYPTKRTSKSGGGDKQRNAIVLFSSPVPHAQVKYDSGEETAFCGTEEEADDE